MQTENIRLKRMLNKQEEITNDVLNTVTSKYGARVFVKSKIADVINIENSGISDKEYKYALMAHFDFVITDKDYRPKFAVEFDGSQHKYDTKAIRRDEIKNNICRKFGFPLLRITSEYFEKIGRFPTILSWITELYFLQKIFDDAQIKGEIPQDEPWMWFNAVDYDPVARYRIFIEKACNKGLCCDEEIGFMSGPSKSGKPNATLSILKLQDDKYIVNSVECLAINYFAIPARDISTEMSAYNIYKEFKKYIEGNVIHTYTSDKVLRIQMDFIEQHKIYSTNTGLIK